MTTPEPAGAAGNPQPSPALVDAVVGILHRQLDDRREIVEVDADKRWSIYDLAGDYDASVSIREVIAATLTALRLSHTPETETPA